MLDENQSTESWALAQDAADPLRRFRNEFLIPPHEDGELTYFVGNSLGLQPRGAAAMVQAAMDDWATLAVEGHFRGNPPWMHFHEHLREGLAEVVGAEPIEVTAMNTLSVNLHLLMVSFYRPTRERPAILMEAGAFPSDRHIAESQLLHHGFDPATDLIELPGDEAGGTISMEAIERCLHEHGHRIALVLWPGVQYRTGQAFDIAEITRMAQAKGCVVGFDLAHAAGNLQLAMHDSGADFAAWCNYKYMNGSPGAVAGAFVHARHAHANLPRFAGWWGHDPATRFQMAPEFTPAPGADGWQLSNPPILGMAPLRASLALFQQAGMAALRAKSEQLTGYLHRRVTAELGDVLEVLTPEAADRRGAQLSLRVRGGRDQGRALFEHLAATGVLGDWREPDVIRISPTPLYNRFIDVHRFIGAVQAWRGSRA